MKKIITLFVLFSFIKIHSQNGLCFTSQPFSLTDVFLTSYAVNDFNSDGKQDVCYAGPNGICVLLSAGSGGFSPTNHYHTVQVAKSIISNDFNGDGKADVAALALGSPVDSLIILFGNGTGNMISRTAFALTNTPTSLVSADFNNDGKIDLATGNYSSFNASLFFGNGNGSFQAPTSYTGAITPLQVISGDFNANGISDLLIMSPGYVDFLSGNSNGTFSLTGNFNLTAAKLISIDANNDGKQDLAYINSTQLGILINNGNFVFSPSTLHSHSFVELNTADFNMDGKMDLASLSGDSIYIFTGAGNGSFLNPVKYNAVFSAGTPIHILSFDSDGNTRPDIFTLLDYPTLPSWFPMLNCTMTGLKDNSEPLKHVNIYPNPASTLLTIEAMDNNINDFSFHLKNVLGKEIPFHFDHKQKSDLSLDLSSLEQGVYFLEVFKAGTLVGTEKIIKD